MLLTSMAAAVLVVVAMALLGEYTKTRGRLLLTALSLAGFCVLALAPTVLSRRPRFSFVGDAGLGVAFLGFLLLTVGTWGTPNSDGYWKAAAIVSIAAGSLAYLSWLLLVEPGILLARIAGRLAAAAASIVPVLAAIGIIVEIKAAPFWWAVTLIIILQLAGGFASRGLNRWRFPKFNSPPV